MYRIREIVESFKGLVGWEQSRADAYKVDESITESESGLYFQEAHPLLTLRAMESIMPSDWNEQYPQYNADAHYTKGAKVQHDGKVYKAKVTIGGDFARDYNEDFNSIAPSDAPITDPRYWEEYNVLTDYLENLTIKGIKRVVKRFIENKVVNMESKSIVDRRTLFDGNGRINAKVENKGRLVGFEISPIRANGITMTLNKVGLQFHGNVGNVTLYLFHSSKSDPVSQKTFNYTSERGSYMWFDLNDWVLPYVTDTTNAGGSWYVVYNQGALAPYMEAINFGRDWSREPCGTCNKGDAQLYRLMTRYVQLSPFYVSVDGWDGRLWDIEDNVYTMGNNYGLNFSFSLDCDLTNFIIAERRNFASVLQLEVATEALRTMALNPEVSVHRVQSNVDRDNILFETDGNGQGIKGLKGELERAYKALEIDTKGLEPICLGCHNKGIKFGSI